MAVVAARLTREEKKAQTRARLIDAAGAVFARRGFVAASLDEVAEEAGLTKGAVYSNFANKEDLVEAVLDDRFTRRMNEILDEVDFDATLAEQARKSSVTLMSRSQEEEWLLLLWLEFTTYAARNPEFRARFSVHHRQALSTMADVIRRSAEDQGHTLPMAAEKLALVTNALGVGLEMEKLQDPEGVPDELFGEVILLLFEARSAAED